MSNQRRREEIKKVREEGMQAFLDGKNRQSVPHAYRHNMDKYQWLRGYDQGWMEAQSAAEDAEAQRAFAIDEMLREWNHGS